jgi:hypothetical protein
MIFRKGGFIAAREQWTYEGKKIEIVNKYKYLGFWLTTKLSENSACEEFSSKAKGKVVEIMKTMWALGTLNTKVFFQLFDAQVKPMLLYAAEIWGQSKLDVIESAHLFACKRLLSVSDKTPNFMVYGETGRYPLHIDSAIASVRYWLKLSKMHLTRFPKQAEVMLRNSLEINTTENWLSKIKKCLELFGFHDIWADGGTRNEAAFIRSLRNRMIDKFKEDWKIKISSSDRFSSYRIFKSEHYIEFYLNDITIKRFRDTLVRLRLGINELGVNKRYNVTNVDNRNCPFCPGIVEDEIHFIFDCPTYEPVRHKYDLNVDVKTLFVLQNPEADFQRKLAMFAFYGLKHREEMLQRK